MPDHSNVTQDTVQLPLTVFREQIPKTVTADRVRDKLEALEITEEDITDAVAWVRQDSVLW